MNPIFLRFWSNLVLNSCNCLDLFTVHLPSMALLFISSFVHSILFSCQITWTSHVFPNPDFFIKMKTDKIINDFICFQSKETKRPCWTAVKVNLFQKHLFLHQLTQNMTKDCSLNYKFSMYMKTAMLCTYINFSECQNKNKQQFVYKTCS